MEEKPIHVTINAETGQPMTAKDHVEALKTIATELLDNWEACELVPNGVFKDCEVAFSQSFVGLVLARSVIKSHLKIADGTMILSPEPIPFEGEPFDVKRN